MTVPLDQGVDLAELGLPWCSIETLHSDGEKLHRVVAALRCGNDPGYDDPAIPQKDDWVLPVLYMFFDLVTGVSEYQREAERMRKESSLEPASI